MCFNGILENFTFFTGSFKYQQQSDSWAQPICMCVWRSVVGKAVEELWYVQTKSVMVVAVMIVCYTQVSILLYSLSTAPVNLGNLWTLNLMNCYCNALSALTLTLRKTFFLVYLLLGTEENNVWGLLLPPSSSFFPLPTTWASVVHRKYN